jgi:hypothetical protein
MFYLNPGGELLIQLLLVPGAQLSEEGGGRLTLPLLYIPSIVLGQITKDLQQQ